MKFSNDDDKKIGRVGIKSERKLAKTLGAKLTPASGALASAKGDMTKKHFLIEAKSTINNSIGVKFEWCEKISQEALETGKTPALSIRFTDPDGQAKRFGAWVMIPEHEYKELVND